jgi:hypothetical protein
VAVAAVAAVMGARLASTAVAVTARAITILLKVGSILSMDGKSDFPQKIAY